MVLKVLNKINSRLKFLYRKQNVLNIPLIKRLLFNALIQPHFDYACQIWYLNLTKAIFTEDTMCSKQMCTILLEPR